MPKPTIDKTSRLDAARASLEGLSIGDAFGERFFVHPDIAESMIAQRAIPAAPWRWTDDTAMALSVVECLVAFGRIDRDDLAARFATRYVADRMRGYGGGAHRLLGAIYVGEPWRECSEALFEGGSYGNGAAMRVAPLGAYFSDDLERAASESAASADPTHAHPEGRAGAIAVGVAAAYARASAGRPWSPSDFFSTVLQHTPGSMVADGIGKASRVPADASPRAAADRLGNGSQISAQDTVPFTLWCASRHADSYIDAMWTTVAGLGDRDTTCAIVGGIVAARVGVAGIPLAWQHARESLGVDA